MIKIVEVLEDGFLCVLLIAMLSLACLQIVLRQFFSGGFLWAEPLLRYLVLWGGFFGAVVATRKGKHIAIDVASYLLPDTVKYWLKLLIDIFSITVAAVLSWAAINFVRNEALLGGQDLLTIPSWCWTLIFPIAFSLIFLHCVIALVQDVLKLAGSPHYHRNSGG
jgi:TRAP-type C4-dicarboxylate transport system permease small subunit